MASKKKKKSSKQKKTAPQPPAPTPPPAPQSRLDRWLLLMGLGLVLLTGWTYHSAANHDFVDWDDYKYVVENDLVRSSADIAQTTELMGRQQGFAPQTSPLTTTLGDVFRRAVALNYHPLTILTLRWQNNACSDCPLGISARPFILGNIWLHIFNSLLVLLLIYCLSKKNYWTSGFVALVFALHPMHVESVVWVSERKDVLYTCFFLLGLLGYWRFLQQPEAKRWWWASLGCFVLACLSKAMAVVFPVVALLLYLWERPERGWAAFKASLQPEAWRPLLPFFVLALFFGGLAVNIQGGGDFFGWLERDAFNVAIADAQTFSLLQRVQFASYGFTQYLYKFFVPLDLSVYYPYPNLDTYNSQPIFWIAPLVLVGTLGLATWSLRHTKTIFVGLWFYFITVALVLQFVSVGMVIMADRYTYVPYIGLAFALGATVQYHLSASAQRVVQPLLLGAAVLLLFKTQTQIAVWQDSDVFWSSVIDRYTINGNQLGTNMATPLSIRGNYYGKLAQGAQDPAQKQLYLDKAFQDFKRADELGTQNVQVYEGLGNINGLRANDLINQARAAQQSQPAQAQQWQQEANQLLAQAIQHYNKAIALNPNSGEAHFNRGVTHSILNNHSEAIADYNKVLELLPQQAVMAHLNRGLSLYALGRNAEAQSDFQQVLRYNPQNALARRYLDLLSKQ